MGVRFSPALRPPQRTRSWLSLLTVTMGVRFSPALRDKVDVHRQAKWSSRNGLAIQCLLCRWRATELTGYSTAKKGVANMKWQNTHLVPRAFPNRGKPSVPTLSRCVRSEWDSPNHHTVSDEDFFQMVRLHQNPSIAGDAASMRFEDTGSGSDLVIGVSHHGENRGPSPSSGWRQGNPPW